MRTRTLLCNLDVFATPILLEVEVKYLVLDLEQGQGVEKAEGEVSARQGRRERCICRMSHVEGATRLGAPEGAGSHPH